MSRPGYSCSASLLPPPSCTKAGPFRKRRSPDSAFPNLPGEPVVQITYACVPRILPALSWKENIVCLQPVGSSPSLLQKEENGWITQDVTL